MENCVAPETVILTDAGYRRIADFENKEVRVWNGEQWSITTVRKTGVNQPLLKVVLTNGMELECTTGHTWFVQRGETVEKVLTKGLRAGDVIAPYDLPVLDLVDEVREDHVAPISHSLKTKLGWVDVPINTSLETKLRWVERHCSAAGDSLEIASVDMAFLREAQLMLTTLGVRGVIKQLGHLNTLLIYGRALTHLRALGLRVGVDTALDAGPPPIIVEKIRPAKWASDTYCFTEPLRHAGVFNGILTGQCVTI